MSSFTLLLITYVFAFGLWVWMVQSSSLSAPKKATTIGLSVLWFLTVGLISQSGTLFHINRVPPPIVLMVLPILLLQIVGVTTKRGRNFLRHFDLQQCTAFQIMRIPVEITLASLAARELVPEMMTFHGYNFDILSGITAPLVALFAFRGSRPNKTLLLLWNIVGLTLLLVVVTIAILSLPGPMHVLNMERPNVAVLDFPYVFIPMFFVQFALFMHIASFVQLKQTPNS